MTSLNDEFMRMLRETRPEQYWPDMESFGGQVNRRLREEFDKALLKEGLEPIYDTTPLLHVKQYQAYMPISMELLDDRTVVLPTPPWHKRFRQRWWWRIYNFRGRLAGRVYKIIAGYECPGWDD